jgi:hypothetical protein
MGNEDSLWGITVRVSSRDSEVLLHMEVCDVKNG